MKVFATTFLCLLYFGMTSAQNTSEDKNAHYRSLIIGAKLVPETNDFIVTDAYKSSGSGATHIYFSQQINGLEVLGTESSIHTSKTGSIFSSNEHFARFSSEENIPSEIPIKSSINGIASAMFALNYDVHGSFSETKETEKPYSFLTSEDYNFAKIKTQLKYLYAKNSIKLIWTYLIQDLASDESWTVLIDANDGSVVQIENWTQECTIESNCDAHAHANSNSLSDSVVVETAPMNCNNCYEVFGMPLESPYAGFRQTVISPADLMASPEGWHGIFSQTGSSDMTTTGNNVWAFDANDNYGYQPDGGQDLNFTGFDWSANYTHTNQYEDASLTNMFYWINITHDILYRYGFDEPAGNFQFTNFGFGGVAGDAVYAKAQKSPNKCNASFGVGPDGTQTVMTTNICGNKDANFDNTVIIHEYGHGIYGRLTGGPTSTYCLYNDERTTEGIADWYAIMLTMKAEDPEELERHIARYFFNRGASGQGIRTYPYSTDMNVNPQTYDDIKTASVPHGVGAVWGNILWEVTWELINNHGFSSDIHNFTGDFNKDAGNVMALGLVTEAQKIQPCTPGFVTARDAIFAADRILYDGQNSCYLWNAFAKRGLGIGAKQRDQDNITDGTESYEMPSPYASFDNSFEYCYEEVVYTYLGGGLPNGGFYSGPGVTDNGDGVSFTLDVEEAGPGTHILTYTVGDGDCSVASSTDTTLTITVDDEAPEVICIDDFTVQLAPTESLHFLSDFRSSVIVYESCDENPVVTQDPEPRTTLGFGEHEITLEVADRFGNTGRCSFLLNIIEIVDESEEARAITLYPNPFDDQIVLDNPNLVQIHKIRIFDVNGRLINTSSYLEKQAQIDLNLEDLSTGLYFIYIETAANQIVKRVLKF